MGRYTKLRNVPAPGFYSRPIFSASQLNLAVQGQSHSVRLPTIVALGKTMGDPPRQLDYASHPRPWYRRHPCRAALVVVVILGCIGAAVGGKSGWKAFERHRMWQDLIARQQKCLDYTAPPTQVVADDDPAHFDKLLKISKSYQLQGGGEWPAYVACTPTVLKEFPEVSETDILFLGGRRSPAGHSRLIICYIRGIGKNRNVYLLTRSTVPATVGKWPTPVLQSGSLMLGDRTAQEHVQFFAGQVDPADASHFTIRYSLDGASHIIDGWLQDDDNVKLTVRGAGTGK